MCGCVCVCMCVCLYVCVCVFVCVVYVCLCVCARMRVPTSPQKSPRSPPKRRTFSQTRPISPQNSKQTTHKCGGRADSCGCNAVFDTKKCFLSLLRSPISHQRLQDVFGINVCTYITYKTCPISLQRSPHTDTHILSKVP